MAGGYLDRALGLLGAIVRDRGERPLTEIAEGIDLPLATAHRVAQSLLDTGHLVRSRRGYYHPGPALTALQPMLDPALIAAAVARPLLDRLAGRFACTAHLGRFDEDMVTYVLKAGRTSDTLFTKEAMQQEAYCSGLGKVLLGGLESDRLSAYLAGGPFIRLTRNTIVDEQELRGEIALTRSRGFAIDNREIRDDLFCIAVPVRNSQGEVFAAISLSFTDTAMSADDCEPQVRALQEVAARVETCLAPAPRRARSQHP